MNVRPNNQHAARLSILTIVALALSVLAPAGSAAAPPPLLSQFCETGGGAGQCRSPRGIATDPATGNVYVADSANKRVNQFSPWGVFTRAWGGGVVSGGAIGSGDLIAGSTKVTSVLTTKKTFLVDQTLTGAGIAPGTTIVDIGIGTLTLSQAATASGSGVALTAPEGAANVPANERQSIAVGGAPSGGSFTLMFPAGFAGGEISLGSNQFTAARDVTGSFHVGDTVSSSGNFPPGTTVTAIDITTNSLTLSAVSSGSGNAGITANETTAPIPFDAPAAAVASALETLPAIGPGNVAVSGPAGGPYEVEFKGPLLADVNVRQLSASAAGLTPSGTVTVATVNEGAGALEVCDGSECMEGTTGSEPGQFGDSGPQGIAMDSARNLYLVDRSNRRVQKFDSAGNFLLSFGGPGSGDGQFGTWPFGSLIAIGPGDEIYVGDEGRIQRFDTAGNYVESIPLPGETVQSLAVDPLSGNLYASLCNPSNSCSPGVGESGSKPQILKLSPAGATLATLAVDDPQALATDAAGNLYVVDGRKRFDGIVELKVRKFSAAGSEVPSFTFSDGFDFSTGIATSSACGIDGVDLFIGNVSNTNAYVRAYGPPPDPGLCPPPPVPPTISDQYASAVDTTGATLKAEINPNFWPDVTYSVQYGTGKCSEGGCETLQPAPPGSKLTTETTNRKVTTAGVFLGDLVPNTTYHYRFVAQSSGGGPVRGVGGEVGNDGAEGSFTTFPSAPQPRPDCPNQGFRSGPSAPLPDCRAYELVSPLEKGGGDADVLEGNYLSTDGVKIRVRARLSQARPDGEKLTYSTFRAFQDPESAPWSSQYLAERDPQAGWQSRAINPPRGNLLLNNETNTEVMFKAFSEDLCSGWLVQETDLALVEGAPPRTPNLYRRKLCGEEGYELLTSVAPTGARAKDPLSNSLYLPMVQAATADGAHTLMRADTPLTKDASTKEIYQLYETSEGPEGKAALRLISVLPDGKAAGTHSSLGTSFGENGEFRSDSVDNALSTDGSRVFWTASTETGKEEPPPGGKGPQPGNLYLRANPLATKSANGKCEEPEKACTLLIAGPNAEFWTADTTGSRAIYQVGAVLFEAQIEEKGNKLVSTSTQIAAGVAGVMGASEDATRVYLTSTNALAPGAVAGKPNLYLYEQGAGFKLVAAGLSELDSSHFDYSSLDNIKPVGRRARVSADGLHAAFLSHAPLTGYDNIDVQSGRPDAELFLYDGSAGSGQDALVCISCNPSGARPEGRQIGVREGGGSPPIWAAAQIPRWESQQYASRLLAPDGSRLYFESFDALVPADTNGAKDVYEWQRAAGPEACAQIGAALHVPASGGCLSLLSTGKSPQDSSFVDASADGRDVFLTTGASLIAADPGLTDIYDARIGGGFATPTTAAACEGEACQGPASPPNDPTPASSAFQGAGNVKPEARPRKPKACAKGKVRRKGRCVVKQQRKGKRATHRQANQKRRAGR